MRALATTWRHYDPCDYKSLGAEVASIEQYVRLESLTLVGGRVSESSNVHDWTIPIRGPNRRRRSRWLDGTVEVDRDDQARSVVGEGFGGDVTLTLMGPSTPRTPHVRGGSMYATSAVAGRSATPMRRVVTHLADQSPESNQAP